MRPLTDRQSVGSNVNWLFPGFLFAARLLQRLNSQEIQGKWLLPSLPSVSTLRESCWDLPMGKANIPSRLQPKSSSPMRKTIRRVLPKNEKQYQHDWHITNRQKQIDVPDCFCLVIASRSYTISAHQTHETSAQHATNYNPLDYIITHYDTVLGAIPVCRWFFVEQQH